jgi:hypothetical protein
MCRQHLPVSVHVDALALCLLQQCVQVMHVMSSHQDALPRHGVQLDLGGCGSSKSEKRRKSLGQPLQIDFLEGMV